MVLFFLAVRTDFYLLLHRIADIPMGQGHKEMG
jgi:hypothetical protein